MIWHLIAAVFAGLGAAGVALLLRKLSRNRLPKWIIPAFAGAAMLAFQLGIEYSWINTKQAQLPVGSQIVDTTESRYFWRPWTYLVPMTTGFAVVEPERIQAHYIEGESLAEFYVYRFERAHIDLLNIQRYLLNCVTGELIPLTEDRAPNPSELRLLEAGDPLRSTVCSALIHVTEFSLH